MAVTCAEGWNGMDGSYKNHESSLSQAEMIQLAESMINVGELNALPVGADQCWKDLATGLKTGDITIVKGIHQRDTKVHFNVISSAAPTRTYHVFVDEGAEKHVRYEKKRRVTTVDYFEFKVSGFSCRQGAMTQLYPSQYQALTELERPIGRARGSSFSTGNSRADQGAHGRIHSTY